MKIVQISLFAYNFIILFSTEHRSESIDINYIFLYLTFSIFYLQQAHIHGSMSIIKIIIAKKKNECIQY